LTCASSVSAGYDDAQAGDHFQGDGHQQQARGGYNNFLSRFNLKLRKKPMLVFSSWLGKSLP